MRFGSSHTRMASFWPPYSCTLATPSMEENCGCTARQIVGQRGQRQRRAGKAHVGHRRRLAGRLDQHRVVCVARQAVLDLVDLGHHLGHGFVGIGVQLHADRDHAAALRGRGRQIVDALHGGHGLRDRLRDEALHQVRRRAGIFGGDSDGGAFGQRILAHRQSAQGAQAQQQDQGADHQRQHGPAHEQIGESHVGLRATGPEPRPGPARRRPAPPCPARSARPPRRCAGATGPT